MAELRPYQRLALYYHKEWTNFVRQYVNILQKLHIVPGAHGAIAVDIACGTGVWMAELSKMGFHVVGMDISEEMISIAKAVCPNGEFVVCDMRRMIFEERVDLVTCTFDSLNYIVSLREIEQIFSNVAANLKTGSHFLFDVNTPRLYEDKQHGTIHRSIDGYEFDQVLNYDDQRKISTTTFKFNDGTYEVHVQKPYTYEEIKMALSDSGMKLVRCFDNLELKPAEPNSYKLYCLAQRCN